MPLQGANPTPSFGGFGLSQSDWSLVILDQDLSAPRADQVLRQARLSPGLDKVPVLYCVENGWTTALLQQLVDELGVRQLLFHPLDREELAREAKAILGLKTPPPRRRGRTSECSYRPAWRDSGIVTEAPS